MPEYRVPIDPRNPGQFYACCGLFEIANVLHPGSLAYFEESGRVFRLSSDTVLPPASLRLADSEDLTGKPYELALEPLELVFDGGSIVLDWWLNDVRTDKSALKTWGGQQTPRGVLSELLGLLQPRVACDCCLSESVFTKSRFGVDATSAWDALDTGYSPNDDGQSARTFPWVEVLAVVGIQAFRPNQLRRSVFRYATWSSPQTILTARALAAAVDCASPACTFEFEVATRGQGYKTFLLAKEIIQ